ncbi:GH32 C-terminal domain-containing protein [Prevotella intermedia]|uniref:GH32 C-terminal domain-containing protein n=1 Tax=Prevotella intermedia TaxID=28131 RepID=UPI000BE77132|nr:GH32 C-terminal domain-containing protein [Prevotella intermedia]PDP68826.1 2,6-beta-D-fructofuranosidase [Prevotella intermedia]
MKRTNIYIMCAAMTLAATSAKAQTIQMSQKGDTTILNITNPTRYLLLPIEEDKDEAKVLLDTSTPADTWMDIRLAQDKVDYYVPFELGNGTRATVKILNLKHDAICYKPNILKLSNEWSTANTDFYRPSYHHTPSYGWMNDPNGMFYMDGIYHLCYQYNPYGSKWGNMHWGHATSTDLIHWKEEKPSIARDTLGHIFSGSAVIDKDNTAGYGKNAIIALYTSASDKNGQIECMAYSTDKGYTYTKYEHNPVLTPFDGLKDFRDPKVFWYEPAKKWYMIISADKEMRFYESSNLKKWDYVSAFGKGYGMQPNQFECPDFVQLPVDGDKNKMKYVMLVNINPGCLFGGSATEYFVGDFDGKNFKCDTPPNEYNFLDYGKDNYATVCFSGVEDRVLSIAWMSNWQYANVTPIKQYRGANTLPRELKLYTGTDGKLYVSNNVAPEVKALRKNTITLPAMNVKTIADRKNIIKSKENAFELEMDVTPASMAITGIELYNAKGEKVSIYFDMKERKLVMDRTESGLIEFGKLAVPHDIEKNYADIHQGVGNTPFRVFNSINYKNDFALGTWAPLSLCEGKTYHIDIFVDKCSVEIFVDGGRIAMTNLVFPTTPYTSVKFYNKGASSSFRNIKISELSL